MAPKRLSVWSLAVVPFTLPSLQRPEIPSAGWEGAGKWASGGESWSITASLWRKRIFSKLPGREVTILMAWAAGRDVSGLCTWESEICLDPSPVVSSRARGKRLLMGNTELSANTLLLGGASDRYYVGFCAWDGSFVMEQQLQSYLNIGHAVKKKFGKPALNQSSKALLSH